MLGVVGGGGVYVSICDGIALVILFRLQLDLGYERRPYTHEGISAFRLQIVRSIKFEKV